MVMSRHPFTFAVLFLVTALGLFPRLGHAADETVLGAIVGDRSKVPSDVDAQAQPPQPGQANPTVAFPPARRLGNLPPAAANGQQGLNRAFTAGAGQSLPMVPIAGPNQATITGPQGQVWSYQQNIQGNTETINRSFIGPAGQTHEFSESWDGKTTTIQNSMTGPQGQTRTTQETITGDTREIERTMVGPNGQTRVIDQTFTPDGVQVQKSFSGPSPSSAAAPVAGAPSQAAAGSAPATGSTTPPIRRPGFTIGSRSGFTAWGRTPAAENRAAASLSPGERGRAIEHQQAMQERPLPPLPPQANSNARGGRN